MTDKRLAAAAKWFMEQSAISTATLPEMLAAIDAADPLRKPVTEDEADALYEALWGAPRHQRRPEVTLRGIDALTAFLSARGVPSAPVDEPLYEAVTATQPGFHGGVQDNPLPDIELRAIARRVFAVEESIEDKSNKNTSTLRALAERVAALETKQTGVEVWATNVNERLDKLDRADGRANLRMDNHSSDLAHIEERLDALEARPAFTAEKDALLRHLAIVAALAADDHKTMDRIERMTDARADIRALHVRMLAVEERVCDNESLRERIDALEAQPAWTVRHD